MAGVGAVAMGTAGAEADSVGAGAGVAAGAGAGAAGAATEGAAGAPKSTLGAVCAEALAAKVCIGLAHRCTVPAQSAPGKVRISVL